MNMTGQNLFDVSARDILLNKEEYDLGDVYPELEDRKEDMNMEKDGMIIVGENTNSYKGISDRISMEDKEEETLEDINQEVERKLKLAIENLEQQTQDGGTYDLLSLSSRFLESIDVDMLNQINSNISIIVEHLGATEALKTFMSPERKTNLIKDVMVSALKLTEEVKKLALEDIDRPTDITFSQLLESVVDIEEVDTEYMKNHLTVEEVFDCDGGYKWSDLVPQSIMESEEVGLEK